MQANPMLFKPSLLIQNQDNKIKISNPINVPKDFKIQFDELEDKK